MSTRDILFQHIENTASEIAVLLYHAEQVQGKARTTYYRSAVFLSGSIVEAVLYELIRQNIDAQPELKNRKTRSNYRKIHTLPERVMSDKRLIICEEEVLPFQLYKQTSFKDMNEFALKASLITSSLFNTLEAIRKKRNEIHLHALSSTQRSFTKKDIERTANALHLLLKRLFN